MTATGTAPLVERDRELAVLDELIGDAIRGEGRLALVEGPAGVGKTELLAEARERGARAMTVLSARASELEQAFPFGVVRQLFEGLAADPEVRSRMLAGAAEAAGAVFGTLADDDAD